MIKKDVMLQTIKVSAKALLAVTAMAVGTQEIAAALPGKTYDMTSGLSLSYSGEPMVGKTAKFVPDASDEAKATLTLSSVFDLSQVPDIPEALKQVIAGPGVIPGSPEVVLPVTLSGGANGEYSFSGSASTDYITYRYAGTVSASALRLDITDAVLANQKLTGSWNTATYLTNEWGDEVLSTPAHIVWTSDKPLAVMEGFEFPMETLLQLVLVMPVINEQNVVTILPEVFKKVDFLSDGNLTADVVSEGKAVTSPMNMAQYVVKDDNRMLLFLDPTAIAAFDAQMKQPVQKAKAATQGGLANLDINNILGNVMAQVAPMLSQGLPLGYTVDRDKLCVYIGEDVLLPLLQKNVVPLLKDTELVQQIADMLAQNPDETIASMAPMIPGIAASLVDVIDATTKIEIGVNFDNASSAAVDSVVTDTDRVETGRYDIRGQRVGGDYRGVVIVRFSDGSAIKTIVR